MNFDTGRSNTCDMISEQTSKSKLKSIYFAKELNSFRMYNNNRAILFGRK